MAGSAGYRFALVEDGRKAIEALEREAFDVVLMGVTMPHLDGLEATRRIRRGEETTGDRLPMIALGTDPGKDVATRCLAAGFDDVVTRPVDDEALSGALERVA